MKKRLLALLMTACVATTAVIGFTGCGDEKEDKEETASGIVAMADIEADIYKDIDSLVELGEYKGIAVEAEKVIVSDEEVQEYIDSELEYYGTVDQIKEGTVADGDTINIDYTGYIDGETFENGSDEGADLTIGSDSFIDGFEDALIGKTIGETTRINVTFPEDYQSEDVAGKAAEFEVKINYKNGETIPAELNDELVASMAIEDVATVDEYKAYVRETLEASAAEEQKSAEFEAILAKLNEVCTVSGLHDDLDEQKLYDEEIEYMEQYAESYSYSYEEFVALYTGMDAEAYETSLKEDIAAYVNRMMIYRAIAKAENISFTQEEYEEKVAGYSSQYESYGCESVEDFEAQFSTQIFEMMVYEEVETLLYDSANITLTDPVATEAPAATEAATE